MFPVDGTVRTEEAVFDDLACLAKTPGYAHAVAAICFRDNVIRYDESPDPESIRRQYSDTRLLRTEIATLIGLMIQAPLKFELPEPQTLQDMIDRTDNLMLELHHSINAPAFPFFRQALENRDDGNPFTRGELLRESIFYGGESAYQFQYREFAGAKYAMDNGWLQSNKGFTIEEARTVVASICEVQNQKLAHTLESFRDQPPHLWTVLPGFMFSVGELAAATGLSDAKVRSILAAFTVSSDETNSGFRSIGDFNVVNALPLIKCGDEKYLCFQGYSLTEALYESPFYWMGADKAYATEAARHRGQFTENFCAERLRAIFGTERVFQNVSIYRGKARVAEIDVLVVFANRAILVEAKSKRLTIESRKGNDNQLQDDFKQGIQAAYDQARASAVHLTDTAVRLVRDDGTTLQLKIPLSDIYIFCVLSDHYPALAFQSRQFLKVETSGTVKPPFVMDIFTLDTIAEMLDTPLYFLSYIDKRIGYADRVMAMHELTVLAYHLKQNLWIEHENEVVQFHDDISVDLDIAMMVRREGLPGDRTPGGILTKFTDSRFRNLMAQLEHLEDAATVSLGFLLLSLNEETIHRFGEGIDEACRRAMMDGRHHDLTVGVAGTPAGVTVHANFYPDERAKMRLLDHCLRRKYSQRADVWYGLSVDPVSGDIRFGITLEGPWVKSDEMDALVADLPGARMDGNDATQLKAGKVGRNEACPCGSGKKFKRCCLSR